MILTNPSDSKYPDIKNSQYLTLSIIFSTFAAVIYNKV